MGKRELFLIVGFIVVGVIAYQIAAPAPREGEQGFSFSRFWQKARDEIMSDAASADFTSEETIPVSAELTEIRLSGMRHGLQVVGEDRQDIAYSMKVHSTGPDVARALEYAKRTRLVRDELGPTLGFEVSFPDEASQRAQLIFRVPRRLGVRLQNVRTSNVSGVASVHLDPAQLDTSISDIAGAVTGTHQRGGRLSVSNVGGVKLVLTNSTAALTGIANGGTIEVRSNANCTVTGSKGTLEIETTNSEIKVQSHHGRLRVGGSGGRVNVEDPLDETRIDVRNSEVEMTIRSPAPVIAQTTDETLRVLFVGPPAITIDAIATGGGDIQAGEFGLTPERDNARQRLVTTLAAPAKATVALRNSRSDIVIRKGK